LSADVRHTTTKFDITAFPQEGLCAALLVSLLSVWVLVGLFYHLNRYTRREYFSIWTGAWLFYALWLTLSLGMGEAAPGSALFAISQFCVSISAALLLWGSMRFLGIPVPQRSSAVFAVFLAVWILASSQLMNDALQIHLPVFILLGLSSPFASVCFLRLRKQKSFVGMGMLSLGFLLWVIYFGSYPFPKEYGNFYGVGFFVAAVLQLFIAISMIVLYFREVQREAEAVREEIEAVRREKEALKSKVITTKEECQNFYNRMRESEESGKAIFETQRTQQTVAEQERLQALGQMTGNVAHDINNALSPITAYTELLLTTLPNLAAIPRQRLERIGQAAEDVARLVAHMREFYRPDPATPPPGSLNTNQTIQPSPEPKLDPDLPPNNGEPCRPLRILCIDDEPDLREVMYDVLELDHHQVTVAAGGMEGLELFRASLQEGDPYEVVITDLGMPDLDGRDVARAIKAESPQTPVIMLTGWGALPKADGQPEPAVDAIISKPPRMQELSNLLFQITARSAT
jgi:CheY-like chemotaxis protein